LGCLKKYVGAIYDTTREQRIVKWSFTLTLVTYVVLSYAAGAKETAPANLVLIHGRIITVDPKDDVVQALAVSSGHVVQLGSDRAIQQLVRPKTRVIDLHGRAATPGLIDAHAHVLGAGLTDTFEIKLSDAIRMQDILDRVGQRAAKAKSGEWIVGSGWVESASNE
jgi:predicted amidohydrolase YtcJ